MMRVHAVAGSRMTAPERIWRAGSGAEQRQDAVQHGQDQGADDRAQKTEKGSGKGSVSEQSHRNGCPV
jgi:hypothetical protein